MEKEETNGTLGQGEDKIHVLIVDDDRETTEFLVKNLVRAGYEVDAAYDGEEAWQKIVGIKPDIVVLDILLPKVSGLEVLKRIRANPETESIGVLILTAKDSIDVMFESYNLGANYHVTKPVKISEVLGGLRTILSE